LGQLDATRVDSKLPRAESPARHRAQGHGLDAVLHAGWLFARVYGADRRSSVSGERLDTLPELYSYTHFGMRNSGSFIFVPN
jgi:hypothetical protein